MGTFNLLGQRKENSPKEQKLIQSYCTTQDPTSLIRLKNLSSNPIVANLFVVYSRPEETPRAASTLANKFPPDLKLFCSSLFSLAILRQNGNPNKEQIITECETILINQRRDPLTVNERNEINKIYTENFANDVQMQQNPGL